MFIHKAQPLGPPPQQQQQHELSEDQPSENQGRIPKKNFLF